jgi:uncharacterized membrane protein YbhN (UPF0104 family)
LLTAKAKKVLSYILKIAILALAFFFIYQRIEKNKDNLYNFLQLVATITSFKVIFTLISIVLLMLVNYVLESFKWWQLTRLLYPITIWQAIESVFCGLTWAVFTPNRIGEYGGRVMFLPVRKRIHGVFAMAVGGFGQNVITNVLGASSLLWFLFTFLNLNKWLMVLISILALALILAMIVFYFNIKWFVSLLNRIKFLKKYHRFFDIMGRYNTAELTNIMLFCLARFFVFSFQYYLIIHLLVPELPLITILLLLFVFLLIQSALPSLDILDIGVRAITASTLFSLVTTKTMAIVVAVSIIYIINLIVPAIIGSIFVFKLKFFDRVY